VAFFLLSSLLFRFFFPLLLLLHLQLIICPPLAPTSRGYFVLCHHMTKINGSTCFHFHPRPREHGMHMDHPYAPSSWSHSHGRPTENAYTYIHLLDTSTH
jgi:hypothetical protein